MSELRGFIRSTILDAIAEASIMDHWSNITAQGGFTPIAERAADKVMQKVGQEIAAQLAIQQMGDPHDELLRRAYRAMRAIDAQSALTRDLAAALGADPG